MSLGCHPSSCLPVCPERTLGPTIPKLLEGLGPESLRSLQPGTEGARGPEGNRLPGLPCTRQHKGAINRVSGRESPD